MLAHLVSRLMLRSLEKGFRRICWVGPKPQLDASKPVVLYANHHTFYDGYVLWLLADRMLGRSTLTWMEEWDRFPLFGAVGALPFPADDPGRRLKTIRGTRRRMQKDTSTLFIYFPEGRLHAPEEGILPFPAENLIDLDRFLPEKQWWPVAIHFTTRGESLPTLLMSGGEPHANADGLEAKRLESVWQSLRSSAGECSTVLLEGRKGPEEGWDLSVFRTWFERYLP